MYGVLLKTYEELNLFSLNEQRNGILGLMDTPLMLLLLTWSLSYAITC